MRLQEIELGKLFGRSVEIVIRRDLQKIDPVAIGEKICAKLRPVAEAGAERGRH